MVVTACAGAIFASLLTPPAQAEVIYVNHAAPRGGDGRSWETAFTSVRRGLAAARRGDEVWVAQGVYRPAKSDGPREKSFVLKKERSLYGGFAGNEERREQRDPGRHVTVLSGDLAGDDGPDFENYGENIYHVVSVRSRIGRPAIADGFTIVGGNADGAIEAAHGGGVLVTERSEGIFRQCMIRRNAALLGGGVLVWLDATATIEHSVIEENRGDGIYYRGGSHGAVRDSRIGGNVGRGLVLIKHGLLSIERCVFDGNVSDRDGGAIFSTGRQLDIRDSLFTGNRSAGRGGAIHVFGGLGKQSDWVNCVFAFNWADGDGGAMLVGTRRVHLTNCTVFGNESLQRGGGVSNPQAYGRSMLIHNCVLFGNRDSSGQGEEAQFFGELDSRLDFCVVQGWTGKYGGTGTIGADPRLVDPDRGDFRLLADSPCIDAADNGAVPEGVTSDLGGNPRFVDDPNVPDTGRGTPPIVDMGAYEFQPGG